MPNTAIQFGRLLILIGIIGYAISVIDAKQSVTALIPAFFGVVFLALGYAARAYEGMRKHLMHVAVIVALIGFLAVAGRIISKISTITISAAFISQLVTALVFLAFIILSVRSFIAARKES
ncbi:MAG: hypothetical protein R2684_01815 [Pyrinomonadaceae bacterium]